MAKGIPKNGINKGWFKKGDIAWAKGRVRSLLHRKHLSESCKGKIISIETRKKMSIARMGHPSYTAGKHWKLSEETKRRIGEKNKISKLGIKQTEEHKNNISKALRGNPKISGENSHSWRGGISEKKYPPYFNASLKLKIRQRDSFACQKCGLTETEQLQKLGRVLSVNHIDFDKSNCNPNNLNTLCVSCNTMINLEREKWTHFFKSQQDKIYCSNGRKRLQRDYSTSSATA